MSQRSEYWRKQEIPVTVDQCICHVGQLREDCPYATPEEEIEVDSRKISSNLPSS